MRRLASSVVLLSTPALAATGGPLDTLMLGSYECERPGHAAAPPTPEPAASFVVTTSSRYSTAAGEGTYLLTGNTITMTSGPLAGTRLIRLRDHFLRRIENGKPGTRCVHARRTDTH